MGFKRTKRKIRCFLRYGPRHCPHIERHSRRPRKPVPAEAKPGHMPRPEIRVMPPGTHVAH